MNPALLNIGFFELLFIGLVVGGFAFWIWMLVDCATKEDDQNQKIVWVIVIAVLGLIGAPLYFFIRKLPRGSRAR